MVGIVTDSVFFFEDFTVFWSFQRVEIKNCHNRPFSHVLDAERSKLVYRLRRSSCSNHVSREE